MTITEEVETYLARMQLSAQEQAFLLHLLKEHVSYYEVLCQLPNASQISREHLRFLEALVEKLKTAAS